MSDLSDELRDIDGVGEATAEKIVDPEPSGYLKKAMTAAKSKDYNTAGIYLLRYVEGQ